MASFSKDQKPDLKRHRRHDNLAWCEKLHKKDLPGNAGTMKPFAGYCIKRAGQKNDGQNNQDIPPLEHNPQSMMPGFKNSNF